MSCEHYWREGVLLIERGEPDPHRDACIGCRREHRVLEALLNALPIVAAASPSDPTWQARVWSKIAHLERPRAVYRWRLPGFLAMAFVAACLCLFALVRQTPMQNHLEIAVVPGAVTTRAGSPAPEAGDHVRVTASPADEIRVYCDEYLLLRCPAHASLAGCEPNAVATVVVFQVPAEGHCRVVRIATASVAPVGDLYRDLQAIIAAGGDYEISELSGR